MRKKFRKISAFIMAGAICYNSIIGSTIKAQTVSTDIASNKQESSILEMQNIDVSVSAKDELHIYSKEIAYETEVFAKEQFSNMGLLNTANIYGLDNEDSANYRLGEGFIVDNIEEEDYITYYPVMNGNEIVAMLQIINDEGEMYASFGISEFSQELNNIRGLSDDEQPFVLLSDDEGIVAVTDDAKKAIVLQTNANAEQKDKQKEEISTLKQKGIKYVTNEEEIASMNYLDIASNNTYSTLPYNKKDSTNISLCSFPVMSDGTNYRILDVDCEEQSGEYCYAYTGSAVIRYLRGGTTAPTAATLKTRKANGSWSTTRSFIKDQMDLYDLDGVSTGVYSYSNIKSQIDDSKPMYSEWWSDNDEGHALSIVGYNTVTSSSTSYKYIYIKDPNFPDNVYSVYYGSGTKEYTTNKASYGNTVFDYKYTVYSKN